MAKSGVCPAEHAKSLAAFYFNLDIHSRKQQMNGEKVLLEFQSCIRREWFDALRRDEGFNIESQRPRRPLESHRRRTERYFRKTMHQFCATLQE